MNQKGEFPRSERCSIRVSGPTKRLLKRLKEKGHNEADVMEYAAKQLGNEPLLLEWEINEIDLCLSSIDLEKARLENEKQAKLNRLRMIAPKRLDAETIKSMMVGAAEDYVDDIFKRAVRFDLDVCVDDFCNSGRYSKSICDYAGDLNFDVEMFRNEVIIQVKNRLCDNDV